MDTWARHSFLKASRQHSCSTKTAFHQLFALNSPQKIRVLSRERDDGDGAFSERGGKAGGRTKKGLLGENRLCRARKGDAWGEIENLRDVACGGGVLASDPWPASGVENHVGHDWLTCNISRRFCLLITEVNWLAFKSLTRMKNWGRQPIMIECIQSVKFARSSQTDARIRFYFGLWMEYQPFRLTCNYKETACTVLNQGFPFQNLSHGWSLQPSQVI